MKSAPGSIWSVIFIAITFTGNTCSGIEKYLFHFVFNINGQLTFDYILNFAVTNLGSQY